MSYKPLKCRAQFDESCEKERRDTLSEFIDNETYDSKTRTYVCNSCLKYLEDDYEEEKSIQQ